MGRQRSKIAPCDDSLTTLVTWLRSGLDADGVSYAALAREIRFDRSWISRALSGRRLPPWPLVEVIARRCGRGIDTARELWSVASAAQDGHRGRLTDGHPPPDLTDYPHFCRALRDLLHRRRVSQRELVKRDQTGHLCHHSTISAILTMRRSASRDITLAIVRGCGVTQAAIDDWDTAWHALAAPYRQAADQRRRDRYSALQHVRWYGAHPYAHRPWSRRY